MIPLVLRLYNFMCYREALVDFNGIHLACLVGDNGAGKSTLLDAITWALWGKARAKHEEELIRLGQSEMRVELEFALGGIRYRVQRTRTKGPGVKSALYFEVWSEREQTWRAIGESALTATERRIVRELRLDYETFINSAFLVQGRADEFTTKQPAERKQVLSNILGLGIYDKYEERAKEKAKEKAEEARWLLTEIEQIDRELARKPEYEEKARQAEVKAARAEEALRQARDLQQALHGEQQALLSQKAVLEDLDRRLQRAEADERQLNEEIGKRSVILTNYEDLLRRRREIEEGYERLRAAREANEALNRRLSRHAELTNALNHWKQVITEAEHRLKEAQREVHGQQESLRKQADQRPMWERLLAEAREKLAQLDQVEQEREALRAQVQSLVEQRARLEGEKHSAKERQETLGKVLAGRPLQERLLAEAREKLAQLDQVAQEREALRAQVQSLAEERARLESENQRLHAEGTAIKEKKALLEQEGDARCPVCGQPLTAAERLRLAADFSAQLEQMRAQYQENRERLRKIAQEESDLKRQAEECDKALNERDRWQQQAGRAEESLRQAEEAENESRHWRRRAEEAEQALAEVVRQEKALKEQMAPLEKALAERSRWQQQAGQAEGGMKAAEAAEAELQDLERKAKELSRILQEEAYAPEARQQQRQVETELARLGYDPQAHEQVRQDMEALSPWEDQHRKLQMALQGVELVRRALEDDRARLERLQESIAADRAQQSKLAQAVARLPEVSRRLAAQEREVEELDGQERRAREELAAARQQLATCERLAQMRVEKAEAHLRVTHEQKLYEELQAAFGKKGIQAMIIETAIPQIEEEANRLLAQMTAGRMHVRLLTQKESKKGDILETLDILIADELGTRSYELYSGGEAFRVNFALRIALSKLLAHRAGATLQTLIVDEGFGTQDAQGRERLVEAIHSIQNEFQRILVITHIDELRDLFPVRIEVTKGADGSTVSVN